jgi:Ca2+-binding EF-hand superfamily protein
LVKTIGSGSQFLFTLCSQDGKSQGHLAETVKNLFHTFDHNKDGKIQQEELRGLVVGIGLEEAG